MRLMYFLFLIWGCRTTEKDVDSGDVDSPIQNVDSDLDGYYADEDCDDGNSLIHPNAEELCDGQDNNCDGEIDEGVLLDFYADKDGDGFGDPNEVIEACEASETHVAIPNDCDDDNADTFPGAPELCDEQDNDCDDIIDNGLQEWWYFDADGDGYGDPEVSVETCMPDDGYVSDNTDCDDEVETTHPDAEELCDQVDNDCDEDIDEDVTVRIFLDSDNDGFGTPNEYLDVCELIEGYSLDGTDCDDVATDVYPGAFEYCDSFDNNCDGVVDEDSAVDASVWYLDVDADGYGNANASIPACYQPAGYVADATDCNDGRALSNPGAPEMCSGYDDDCDGTVDEAEALDSNLWYADTDNDGYGDAAVTEQACYQPTGFVSDASDCNDARALSNPGALETCSGYDDDCDGSVDESDAIDASVWYLDDDGDGFGNVAMPQQACYQPTSYVSDATDCDDARALSYPGATETCSGYDDDCDGSVDESDASNASVWYFDGDGDGYGNAGVSQQACYQPTDYVSNSTDCDDARALSNPGAVETCSGYDDDCDGTVDESDASNASVWYYDGDGDGYGNGSSSTLSCYQPSSYVSNASDCNDSYGSIYPGATEVCNGLDDNCDGSADLGWAGSEPICPANSCSQVKSSNPSSSDGVYWVIEFGSVVQAYCDMTLQQTLCSEYEQERYGQTREGSQVNYTMTAVLDTSNGTCEIWALRASSTNTPFDNLGGSPLNTCQALGFLDDHQLNYCSYGSAYGTCGFTADLYYRYGYACAGCTLNDGYYSQYVRQGYMSSSTVISTMDGSVRSYCKTQ